MISVLINNHNHGEFIGEAIASVMNQTYRDFELIIVDGDSDDNSREVIMSYVNQYPDKITAVFKPTSGQAAAFNVGYKMSRGDILAFLDSDDYFFENKLERIAELHREYNVIGNGRVIHEANGERKEIVAIHDDYLLRPELLKKYGYIYTYNLITACISMKREVADKIFPMPEEGYATFADCYVKVLAQYYDNIKYVDDPLTYYRIHHNQKTQSIDREELEQFVKKLYKRVFKDINKLLIQKKEPLIPELNKDNLIEAVKLTTPGFDGVDEKFAIYGCGSYSYSVKRCIEQMGGEIICAIDSDNEKVGQIWCGIPIISLDEALKEKNITKIIIGSFYYAEDIARLLDEKGLCVDRDYIILKGVPCD